MKNFGSAKVRALVAGISVMMVLIPTSPAAAAVGRIAVAWDVEGVLPKFPCPEVCSVQYSGPAAATGQMDAIIGGRDYDISFTLVDQFASGEARYLEPGLPYCMAGGSADGFIQISGPASGSLVSTWPSLERGNITWVSIGLSFTYERFGSTVVLTFVHGAVVLFYTFIWGGDIYREEVVVPSFGTATFVADPVMMAANCTSSSGPLPFKLIGNAAVEVR